MSSSVILQLLSIFYGKKFCSPTFFFFYIKTTLSYFLLCFHVTQALAQETPQPVTRILLDTVVQRLSGLDRRIAQIVVHNHYTIDDYKITASSILVFVTSSGNQKAVYKFGNRAKINREHFFYEYLDNRDVPVTVRCFSYIENVIEHAVGEIEGPISSMLLERARGTLSDWIQQHVSLSSAYDLQVLPIINNLVNLFKDCFELGVLCPDTKPDNIVYVLNGSVMSLRVRIFFLISSYGVFFFCVPRSFRNKLSVE